MNPSRRIVPALAFGLVWIVALGGDRAAAADGLRLEIVHSPVWIEAGRRARAARPGSLVAPGERIRTGRGARVVARLPDASTVKLGELARFEVDALREREAGESRYLAGILDVVRGAFRYTAEQVRGRARPRLDIRVSAITIGIRGTDVWGKAEGDRDFVVLIEGTVEVRRGEEARRILSEPRSVYSAPKDAPVDPPARIDTETLSRLAAETEPQAGAGVMREGGAWIVNVASSRDPALAEEARERLDADGWAVAIETAIVEGAEWQRLVIRGLASAEDARALASRLGAGAWVSRARSAIPGR